MEDGVQVKREPNPRESASILSILTFFYTLPIFLKGRKKDFSEDDVYETLRRDKSSILGDKAEKIWTEELKKFKDTKKTPNVRNMMMRMLKFNLAGVALGHLINDLVCRPGQIVSLGYLISYYLDESKKEQTSPYFYVAGLLSSTLCSVFILQLVLAEGFHTGMEMRIAACSLIYRKALKLNQSAFGDTTVGQMINLLSNDVGVFDRFTAVHHCVYVGPAQLALFTYLMYNEIGVSAFVGVSVLILFIPLQGFMGKLSAKFRLKTARRTDARIRLMDEIIRGIEVIKMYAWEKSFAKLVHLYRRLEIKSIKTVSYIKGTYMMYFIYISVPLFLTILAYVLFGNTLDARKFFYTSALYNTTGFTMATIFPQAVSLIKESGVASARIVKFLMLEEADTGCSKSSGAVFIKMANVTAKWAKSAENTLSNLNLNIEPGTIVAVIGPVGSGKSSLLQCILKELRTASGVLSVGGSVSYSSQDPWIFNSSVRQNILFGKEMDKPRYRDVVNKCALSADFKTFLVGDRTIVGEQGSFLSGGQRARVNLARAVYRDSDIYLLDDPFSAVDVSVGKQIFEECVCRYLKKKTVILVTHQLQYLQHVDRIIVLENGTVKADGTFNELQKSNLNFLKLLKRSSEKDDDEHKESRLVKYESAIKLDETPKLVQEQRSTGTVSFSIYKDYFAACGSYALVFLVITLFIFVQLVLSGSFYFMTYWVNFEQKYSQNDTLQGDFKITSRNYFVYIYSGITVAIVVLTVLRNNMSYIVCMRSSINLHDSMFDSVVRATLQFFNENSSGRILNRFTKDMGAVDELLPTAIIITTQTVFSILGIIIVTCIVNPWLIIPSALILILSNYLKSFYLSASLSIKRLEGVTKSPVFGHLHATLRGLTTIRGFSAQDILRKEFDDKQDLHSSTYYLFICTTRTLGYWLDIISFIYITCITLVLVFISDESYGGNVGLAITQAMQLLLQLQWGVRQSTDMENYMTSVERVLEYNSIDHERPFTNANKPDNSWPKLGKITFENVYLSYSLETPVLKNLNFVIEPEEKVGIVGRTGAGKSSIISSIFQLFEIEGNIIIDGVNIKEIGLHDLRRKISIIPQNPVIFAGSIRKNLDPFDECTDEVLWKALEDVKLKETIKLLDLGLKSEISEGGSNLSAGQRQLICLARAIIRGNKILILDEATANVDPQTDAVIQDTIRQKFSKYTVITVAHRLHTVIDSDKILVMDGGKVVEFGHPYVLLQDQNGVFYQMVQQTENIMASELAQIAKVRFEHT
ncbi:hypothetical protein RN001_007068 [Aquatica leii]|uniref:Multidrug resistance-associated protein lethal(2)03659 n=1 Tax=Aquatica leii TaxID=1421715 RepID=A0AAN7P7W4_9COLE|nr:hypothetical protein RN001_007068 [Aquatica leii]